MIKPYIVFAASLAMGMPAMAQSALPIAPLMAEAGRLAELTGDELWPGYSAAPFGLLLVEADAETLVCQDASGFEAIGVDPMLNCQVSRRAPSGLPTNRLAAMPIFGPPSTIVVGTPGATQLSPEAWTLTLLHEHFHQWQSSLAGYYDRVAALDLAGDDQTGMWMINFPVPYDHPAVTQAQAAAAAALKAALDAQGTAEFVPAVREYLAARQAFARSMDERSWRYVEFQLWQEGVARWTEIEIGLRQPSGPLRASAENRRAAVLAELDEPDLSGRQRVFVYAHGAGEAMLLEACDPLWRSNYAKAMSLGAIWATARCVIDDVP